MAVYRVQFVEGESVAGGGAVRFLGMRGLLAVEASGRVEAYLVAFDALRTRGEVTVLLSAGVEGRPLGFGKAELEAVRLSGVPLTTGYPRAGVQIETIVDDAGT